MQADPSRQDSIAHKNKPQQMNYHFPRSVTHWLDEWLKMNRLFDLLQLG
jgi:hypothetical protein